MKITLKSAWIHRFDRFLSIYTIAPNNNIGILAPDKTSYFGWNMPFYLLLK